MTCEKCSDLCVRVSIKRPHELRNAIRIAWQNILDNTLSEIVNPNPISSVTFAELAKGEPWDDLLRDGVQNSLARAAWTPAERLTIAS